MTDECAPLRGVDRDHGWDRCGDVYGRRVHLEFVCDGVAGRVSVDAVVNEDPVELGCPPDARGFPVCTASVEFPPLGYRSLFGWVQLVRSTDNASGGERFGIDPFALFFDAPSPYCWYGTAPTLFDAPHRATRSALTWTAHSFLATTPLEEAVRTWTRPVVPLLGFSWGFGSNAEGITLQPITRLGATDWNGHLTTMRQTYAAWEFRDASAAFECPTDDIAGLDRS